MKAVIETGGKQYYVEKGSIIYTEKIDVDTDKTIEFHDVMMANGVIGHPYVKGAKVIGKVIKHGKNKKILVFKYKPKKKYRRTQGHRQPYTKIEITDIIA